MTAFAMINVAAYNQIEDLIICNITLFKRQTIGNKLDKYQFGAQLKSLKSLNICLTRPIIECSILGNYGLQFNNC
jgi:hypothetical protein